MTEGEGNEMLDRAVNVLMEHFDAVQILATYTDGEGTLGLTRGGGNWYARKGMVQEFIDRDFKDLVHEPPEDEE